MIPVFSVLPIVNTLIGRELDHDPGIDPDVVARLAPILELLRSDRFEEVRVATLEAATRSPSTPIDIAERTLHVLALISLGLVEEAEAVLSADFGGGRPERLDVSEGGFDGTWWWREALATDAAVRGHFADWERIQGELHEAALERFGDNRPISLRAAILFAAAKNACGDFFDAAQLARSVLDRATATLGPTSPLAMASAIVLSNAYTGLDRFKEAVALLAEESELGSQTQIDQFEGLRRMVLSHSHFLLGEFELAFGAFGPLIDQRAWESWPESDFTCTLLCHVAAAFEGVGQKSVSDELDTTITEWFKPDNPSCGMKYSWHINAFGRLLPKLTLNDEHDSAIALARCQSDYLRRWLGSARVPTLYAACELALALGIAGRFGESITTAREALELASEARGGTHPETLYCAGNCVNVLLVAGREVRAAAIVESWLPIRAMDVDGQFGYASPSFGRTTFDWMQIAVARAAGKEEFAGTLATQLIERATEVFGPGHRAVTATKQLMAMPVDK